MSFTKKSYIIIAVFGLFLTNTQATVFKPLPTDIQEPSGIYDTSQPDVLTVGIKTIIGSGPCVPGDYSGCTLSDVNNDTDATDDFKPEVKIHFTADDFPDEGKVSNATLRLRGSSSRYEDLKSYRIKLDSKKDLWRGERNLQLNKHLSDLTRVRNKLSFDLMTTIPNLPSLRTQFVHFFIDDEDYGLYTHVERVGKEYLIRRKWDKDSNIYKAEDFDFTMNDALLIDGEGKPLDESAFETILEIKRGDDARNLIDMIKAVSDEKNDFKRDVLDKYFNLNNFLTWEAVNILMGNTDVTTYNFYLLNPKDSDTFYFLPWDFDSTWGYDWQPTIVEGNFVPAKRYQGPHNLWATAFGKRFLSQPGALELLNEAVKEIKEKYLTPSIIKRYTDSYYNLVFPLISTYPDIDYLDTNQDTEAKMFAEYNEVYEGLVEAVQRNYDRFLKEQNSPMPFHIDTPYLEGTDIVFTWEDAVDLQNDNVTYDLEISDSPEFKSNNIKFSMKDLKNNTFTTQWMLPHGVYYYRVIARDTSNPRENWQLAFEEYYDSKTDFTAYGVVRFKINADGTLLPPEAEKIIIDGKQKDWKGVKYWRDPDDISSKKAVDWRKAWFTEDMNNIYLAYRNDSNINKDKLWAWHVYMDTDDNADSGYLMGSLGAEYLLEGDLLWKYTGNGETWSWQQAGMVEYAVKRKFAEFSIPKRILENPSGYKFLFYGANSYLVKDTQIDTMTIHPEKP